MANAKVSKKIQELIKTATPKQKAIMVCRDWLDRNQMQQEPLLTEEEARAIPPPSITEIWRVLMVFNGV